VLRSRVLFLAVLVALLTGVPAAQARLASHVVSGYVYLDKETNPRVAESTAGELHAVFRTNRALRFGDNGYTVGGSSIAGGTEYAQVISQELNCYEMQVTLDEKGRIYGGSDVRALVGDRVRVRVEGFSRRFVVQPRRFNYPRGRELGCAADRKSQVVLFNLTAIPSVTPERYFFTANSGPYVKNLRWIGWGTQHAAGRGRFISDCASCGTPEHVDATLKLSGLTYCRENGLTVYRRGVMIRTLPDGTMRRTKLYTGFTDDC
jgi:hypothetical protein